MEKPTNYWHNNPNRVVVHINFTSADVDDIYMPHLEVVGDIANTLWQLYESDLNPSLRDDMYADAHIMQEMMLHQEALEKSSSILMPRTLASSLRQLLEREDILSLDNGFYKVWLARNYPAYTTNTILLDNALATM